MDPVWERFSKEKQRKLVHEITAVQTRIRNFGKNFSRDLPEQCHQARMILEQLEKAVVILQDAKDLAEENLLLKYQT